VANDRDGHNSLNSRAMWEQRTGYVGHGAGRVGRSYWHMGNIINRCPKSETYEQRKAEGRLPKD
jgi:hypothetical protein